MKAFLSSALLMCCLALAASEWCANPQISTTTFTSKDNAVLTQTAFIAEFQVRCEDSQSGVLYAEVAGMTMPAAKVGEDKFQVSWTEEAARGGERQVRLYSEESITALRKARRSGEEASVPVVSIISLNYSAGYSGPSINSEVMAAVLIAAVAYVAISNKSKILSTSH